MPVYTFRVTKVAYAVIEAESKEEATEKARQELADGEWDFAILGARSQIELVHMYDKE